MKKVLLVIAAAVLVLSLAACGQTREEYDPTEDVLAFFADICKVPHPSHNEEDISEFLYNWAQEQGFDAQQDGALNVIVDVPATEGMEDRPLTALQAHIDMVFAHAAGENLNPLTTQIKMVRDGEYLRSDHRTSLGADDGIGVSMLMNIACGKMAHGPLRLFFTADEEDGDDGAFGIDPALFSDVKYLINLDGEEEGIMYVGAAGSFQENFSMDAAAVEPTLPVALEVKIQGLSGGHSGLNINKGRQNAIKSLGEMLEELDAESVEFELSSFTGGEAPNVIATSATAVICVAEADADRARSILLEKGGKLKKAGEEADPDMEVSVEACEKAKTVFSKDCKIKILCFIGGVAYGVHSMSDTIEGLVETSSNIGKIKADAEGFSAVSLVRSFTMDGLEEASSKEEKMCGDIGISYSKVKTSEPWEPEPGNTLAEIADGAYKDLFGKELEHSTPHGGLECGTFSQYNPEMKIISIGPNILNAHSVDESVEIESIFRTWMFVEEILARV